MAAVFVVWDTGGLADKDGGRNVNQSHMKFTNCIHSCCYDWWVSNGISKSIQEIKSQKQGGETSGAEWSK